MDIKLKKVLDQNLKLQKKRIYLNSELKSLDEIFNNYVEESWGVLFDDMFQFRKYRHITKTFTTNMKYKGSKHNNVNYGFKLHETTNELSLVLMNKSIEGYIEKDYLFTIKKDEPFEYFHYSEYDCNNSSVLKNIEEHINALHEILAVWGVHKSIIEKNFYNDVVSSNARLEKEIAAKIKRKNDILDIIM